MLDYCVTLDSVFALTLLYLKHSDKNMVIRRTKCYNDDIILCFFKDQSIIS